MVKIKEWGICNGMEEPRASDYPGSLKEGLETGRWRDFLYDP
jgi:hypothetical protein